MKKIILLVALVGLFVTATAQQPAADLRKSATLSTAKADNSLSIYQAGQVLYATDSKLTLTKAEATDFSTPEAAKGISYAGERETYAYDAKTQILYTVVKKKDQKTIKSDNKQNIVPSDAENVEVETYVKGSTLRFWNWVFSGSTKTELASYSAKDPSLSADGNRLYFSSTREGGYGGYDIWYLNRNADGTWSDAINAGGTINSAKDEEYPFLWDGILLFSSNRDGNFDLFAIVNSSLKKLDELNSTADDINPIVSGGLGAFVSNRDGNDDIYLFNPEFLKPAPPKPEPKPEPVPEPKPEPVPEPPKELPKEEQAVVETAFKNLTFETNKAVIKEGKSDLDKLAEILKKYPNAVVTLSGHTDNTGTASRNNVLSQERADAVKNYLVEKDVKANQITAKGYGSTQPIADNATVEGRTKNRRVEIDVKI